MPHAQLQDHLLSTSRDRHDGERAWLRRSEPSARRFRRSPLGVRSFPNTVFGVSGARLSRRAVQRRVSRALRAAGLEGSCAGRNQDRVEGFWGRKHPCFESRPDPAFFGGFRMFGPGLSTGCPQAVHTRSVPDDGCGRQGSDVQQAGCRRSGPGAGFVMQFQKRPPVPEGGESAGAVRNGVVCGPAEACRLLPPTSQGPPGNRCQSAASSSLFRVACAHCMAAVRTAGSGRPFAEVRRLEIGAPGSVEPPR